MIPTTPHKSASSSNHWGRFCLLSSLFHFHPLFSLWSFEPHHSFSFSVFPFHPHTLSIIPPSLCLLPLLLSSIFLFSLITSLSSLSCNHPRVSKWKHFLFIFWVFKNHFPSHSLIPLALCFSALVRPPVFLRLGRVMNVLFYGKSQVYPSLCQNRP